MSISHCATCRCAELPQDTLTEEEWQFIRQGRVLEAVRCVRSRTGLLLREAKALVDRERAKAGQ